MYSTRKPVTTVQPCCYVPRPLVRREPLLAGYKTRVQVLIPCSRIIFLVIKRRKFTIIFHTTICSLHLIPRLKRKYYVVKKVTLLLKRKIL